MLYERMLSDLMFLVLRMHMFVLCQRFSSAGTVAIVGSHYYAVCLPVLFLHHNVA